VWEDAKAKLDVVQVSKTKSLPLCLVESACLFALFGFIIALQQICRINSVNRGCHGYEHLEEKNKSIEFGSISLWW